MFTALLLITIESMSDPGPRMQVSMAHPFTLFSEEECVEMYPQLLEEFDAMMRLNLSEADFADMRVDSVDAQCVSWTNS